MNFLIKIKSESVSFNCKWLKILNKRKSGKKSGKSGKIRENPEIREKIREKSENPMIVHVVYHDGKICQKKLYALPPPVLGTLHNAANRWFLSTNSALRNFNANRYFLI